jgi:hypothetical protein
VEWKQSSLAMNGLVQNHFNIYVAIVLFTNLYISDHPIQLKIINIIYYIISLPFLTVVVHLLMGDGLYSTDIWGLKECYGLECDAMFSDRLLLTPERKTFLPSSPFYPGDSGVIFSGSLTNIYQVNDRRTLSSRMLEWTIRRRFGLVLGFIHSWFTTKMLTITCNSLCLALAAP